MAITWNDEELTCVFLETDVTSGQIEHTQLMNKINATCPTARATDISFEEVDRTREATLYFNPYPTSEEKTTIEELIINHVPIVVNRKPIAKSQIGEVTSTNGAWVDALSLTTPPLEGGVWQFNATCELKSSVSSLSIAAQMQIIYRRNGGQWNTVMSASNNTLLYDTKTKTVSFLATETDVFDIIVQVKRAGTSGTAYLKGSRITVNYLGEAYYTEL